MYHFPFSYEQELKEQIAERRDAIEQIHRAQIVERRRPPFFDKLTGNMRRLLVHLGTLMEQPGRSPDDTHGCNTEQSK
jgi:hypothetical protein